MKRIKFVYIYFLFLLYFIIGYFINVPFIDKGIYEKIYRYMGIIAFPMLLFFILYAFVFMINDKKRRFFWELRLYYIFIIFFIGIYLYILFSLGVDFINVKTFVVNDEFLKNLINKSLFEYKIGYLPTYIFYEFIKMTLKFNQFPFYYFYYGLFGLGGFLFILMFFNPVRKSVKKSNARRRKERQRARIEAELMEQIKIKEDLERKEALRIQKHKKMEEDAIKKKADSFQKKKKNKRASRKRNSEIPLEEEIENRMGGVILQKTVTIDKED